MNTPCTWKPLLPYTFVGILPLYSAQDPIQKGLLVCLTPQISSLPYFSGFTFFSSCFLLPLLGAILSFLDISECRNREKDTFSSSQLLPQE